MKLSYKVISALRHGLAILIYAPVNCGCSALASLEIPLLIQFH